MPTYEVNDQFWHEWQGLSGEQQALFRAAVRQTVAHLRAKRQFAKRLRVKGFRSRRNVSEMTWAKDGRALFTYGTSPHSGDTHIRWLRIGTHDIF